jgi:hypothetical protein
MLRRPRVAKTHKSLVFVTDPISAKSPVEWSRRKPVRVIGSDPSSGPASSGVSYFWPCCHSLLCSHVAACIQILRRGTPHGIRRFMRFHWRWLIPTSRRNNSCCCCVSGISIPTGSCRRVNGTSPTPTRRSTRGRHGAPTESSSGNSVGAIGLFWNASSTNCC